MKRSELKKIVKETADSFNKPVNIYKYLASADDPSLPPPQRVVLLKSTVEKYNELYRKTKAGKYVPKAIVANYLKNLKSQQGNIQEGEKVQQLKQEMGGFFDPVALYQDAKNTSGKNDQMQEMVGTTTAMLVLAIPHFVQGIATMVEKLSRTFKKDIHIASPHQTPGGTSYTDAPGDTKADKIQNIKTHNKQVAMTGKGHKQYSSTTAQKIDHIAHAAHDMVLKPIELALKVVSATPKFQKLKDPKIRKKVAEGFYIAIMVYLCGAGAIEHFGHAMSGVDIGKLADLGLDAGLLFGNLPTPGKNANRFEKLLGTIIDAIHV